MKIAFTVCTNSFLSLARVLGKSVEKYNSDYTFFIGLADLPDQDLVEWYAGFRIVPCADIGIEDLHGMAINYSVSDIKNALKPFYLEYFSKKYPDVENILFIDPDMVIYGKLSEIDDLHQSSDILLFPHILKPQPFDGKMPSELSYLSTGTYNLGLISVKVNANTLRFISWWCERLRHYCYVDWKAGLYYDQKWIILVPVFFEKVEVVRHPGYNVAYWNLHERKLSVNNDEVRINDGYPLIIYHFSNVDVNTGKLLTDQQDRFSDGDIPIAVELFSAYRKAVLEEGFEKTRNKVCYYANLHENYTRQMLKKTIKGRIKLWLKNTIPATTRVKWKKKLGSLFE